MFSGLPDSPTAHTFSYDGGLRDGHAFIRLHKAKQNLGETWRPMDLSEAINWDSNKLVAANLRGVAVPEP